MKSPVHFKAYNQHQITLFPASYDDYVAKNHPVRIVNQILDGIDISSIEATYKGGGTSSYHPRMLLKVIIYAYLRNIYSSRKIEQALQENVHFMWLSAGNKPDHNTINDFRGKRLKNELQSIFSQVVLFLNAEGVLSLKDLYVDGTKLEANANKYTFVWAKSIQTNKKKIEQQLKELWSYVESVYKQESLEVTTPDIENITPEKVTQAIDKINQALATKKVDKKVKQKLNYAKKNWSKNLEKYEKQEALLSGRNSYSKTDVDATFMRMKDDHMKNGQLKAGYNLQISTNTQYITHYSLAQTTADTTTLKNHIQEHIEVYGQIPETLTADAGYGSEENYQDLESKQITTYVKYAGFHKEQKNEKKPKNPFESEHLYYNQQQDCYYCPMGQQMKNIGSFSKKTKTGFEQTVTQYQAQNCKGCPLRGLCFKGKGNRIIQKNYNVARHRKKAKELLTSEKGIEKRKQRCWDVEAVFGNIKQNMNFKRFMLRGMYKVKVETGLIALAHNLKKYTLQLE